MKSLGTLMLRLRLEFARLDALLCVGAALCVIGATDWYVAIPQLRKEAAAQRIALTGMQERLAKAAVSASKMMQASPAARIQSFYDVLGEKHYAEQQIKTLFAVAGKNNIRLDQAEYKWTFDRNGRYYIYQITLPVRGTYPALRQFCEQVLLAIPFGSLDEIGFKRDSVGSNVLEGHLRFTLYLSDISFDGTRHDTPGGEPR